MCTCVHILVSFEATKKQHSAVLQSLGHNHIVWRKWKKDDKRGKARIEEKWRNRKKNSEGADEKEERTVEKKMGVREKNNNRIENNENAKKYKHGKKKK